MPCVKTSVSLFHNASLQSYSLKALLFFNKIKTVGDRMRPRSKFWRIPWGLPCETPKATGKGPACAAPPRPFLPRKECVSRMSPTDHGSFIPWLSILENTAAQRTHTLVTWTAGRLGSLVIKTCTRRVLMLFLMSSAPLPMILRNPIIPNIVRS